MALGLAGDGEVARYISRSAAPSSPETLAFRWRKVRDLVGGGVRGGEDLYVGFILKLCWGRLGLSPSETWPNGESGTVDISETKEMEGW